MQLQWTSERVKRELPSVRVQFCHGETRHEIDCVVKRGSGEALVMPFEHGSATVYHYHWHVIADCLNNGFPLTV